MALEKKNGRRCCGLEEYTTDRILARRGRHYRRNTDNEKAADSVWTLSGMVAIAVVIERKTKEEKKRSPVYG
jgi:hypothetical protein